ncbi:hypothetical protein JCM10212_004419 [Sporobolomyces blumeae]
MTGTTFSDRQQCDFRPAVCPEDDAGCPNFHECGTRTTRANLAAHVRLCKARSAEHDKTRVALETALRDEREAAQIAMTNEAECELQYERALAQIEELKIRIADLRSRRQGYNGAASPDSPAQPSEPHAQPELEDGAVDRPTRDDSSSGQVEATPVASGSGSQMPSGPRRVEDDAEALTLDLRRASLDDVSMQHDLNAVPSSSGPNKRGATDEDATSASSAKRSKDAN